MEGSLVAYKVFTNGSVLQASEVNENLMQQAVATFSNAAARTAAITSPVEGQLTYLLDVDRYDHWTGGAWVSPFGMTLLNRTTFTSQTAVTVSNVFTSAYKNYRIDFHASGGTANTDIQIQLAASGTPASTNYLEVQAGGSTTSTQNTFNLTSIFDTTNVGTSCEFWNPALAQKTTFSGRYFFDNGSTFQMRNFGGVHRTATAYDGFRIFGSTAFSGSLVVFGIRNA
jgi:hypothetical protein